MVSKLCIILLLFIALILSFYSINLYPISASFIFMYSTTTFKNFVKSKYNGHAVPQSETDSHRFKVYLQTKMNKNTIERISFFF